MTAFAGDRHSTKGLCLFQNCIHTDDLKAQGCGKLKKAVFSIELDEDAEETEE